MRDDQVIERMVRVAGLEPARTCVQEILSLSCLPIPPHPQDASGRKEGILPTVCVDGKTSEYWACDDIEIDTMARAKTSTIDEVGWIFIIECWTNPSTNFNEVLLMTNFMLDKFLGSFLKYAWVYFIVLRVCDELNNSRLADLRRLQSSIFTWWRWIWRRQR